MNDELLPPSLRQLAGLIGLDAVVRLVEKLGGTTWYVPATSALTDDHPLVDAVGMAAASRIAGEHAGNTLHIAKACAAVRAARDARIVHQYHVERLSQRELALRWRLDERHIRTICSRTRLTAETPQQDLFDLSGEARPQP